MGKVGAPDFSAMRGRRILIALSGGADSVALAVMLREARDPWDLTLYALHVDHAIRPDSAEDAEFCRALCARLDIPFEVVRVDAAGCARQKHCGLETAARALRHGALERYRASLGADVIALAHHMDDQAETVLMHLARGAGLEGIRGMRQRDAALWRPLLGFRKAELIEYLREKGYDWREDSTNRIADNPRNALRLRVIPELERWYPQFTRAVARCASTAQVESAYLEELTERYLAQSGFSNPYCAWLELDPPPPRALLRRALRAQLREDERSWETVNALEALCGQPRGKIDISRERCAERTGSRLYILPKQPPMIEPAPLSLDGETRLGDLCAIRCAPCAPTPIRDDPARQALNPKALRGAVVRTRRPGDRIRPLGCGDKLLSDYFIDKKVDRPLRDLTPLVAVGERVHWVCGIGISQEAAIAPGGDAVMLEYQNDFIIHNGGKRHAE